MFIKPSLEPESTIEHLAHEQHFNQTYPAATLKKYWFSHRADMGLSIYDTARVARLVNKAGFIFADLIDLLISTIKDNGIVGELTTLWQHNLISALSVANTLILTNNSVRCKQQITNVLKFVTVNISRLAHSEQINISNSDLLFNSEFQLLNKLTATHNELIAPSAKKEIKNHLLPLCHTAARRISQYNSTDFLFKAKQSLYSLEAFPDKLLEVEQLRKLFEMQGSIFNSPSATAKYFEVSRDDAALLYLKEVALSNAENGMQCLYPFLFQEINWVLLFSLRGGLDIESHFPDELNVLRNNLTEEGLGASHSLPKDADDTSVAMYILSQTNHYKPAFTSKLLDKWWSEDFQAYETFGKSFRSKPDISTNIHVLAAIIVDNQLTRSEKLSMVKKILAFVYKQANYDGPHQEFVFWNDKWNISSFYPASEVAHTLLQLQSIFPDIEVEGLIEKTINWILHHQTKQGDFRSSASLGVSLEETGYAIITLKNYLNLSAKNRIKRANLIKESINRGLKTLDENKNTSSPPLWVAKGLYTPRNIIKSITLAAKHLFCPEAI